MTVKELFNSLTFDEVINALRNTHRNDSSIQNVAAYKEAFDTICLMEFDGEGGEVTFDVTSPREAWYEPHNLPLIADNVEGDYWENTVGKTVVKPVDNPFTDAELAGAILWGMTFYGFSRHSRWSLCEEHFTSFGDDAERLERRLYLPYLRDKQDRRELMSKKEMPFGIAFSMETWEQIHHRINHQNRPKRKRYYRLKKRIAYLKRMDKRQHLIDTIHEKCGLHDSQLETCIMNAGSITEVWRGSHVSDKSSRAEYLAALLTKYYPTLSDIYEKCDELLVIAYTSHSTPLTDEEEQTLKNIFVPSNKNHIPTTFVRGTDNEAKEDISLQIIILSTTIINEDDD